MSFIVSALGDVVAGTPVEFLSLMAWGTQGGWFDAALFGLALPALPFGLWRARRADATRAPAACSG